MKLPRVLSYFIVLALPVYLAIAFSIGYGVGSIPFILYDRYYPTKDTIIIVIFHGIPSILAGFLAAYLAFLPIRYYDRKTDFTKDNFSK